MTGDRGTRASDHDRDAAAEVLRAAYANGRLDLDELRERLGAAFSAKTWGELHDLTADLPEGQVLSGGWADGCYEVVELYYLPRHPFTRMCLTAVGKWGPLRRARQPQTV